MRCYASAGLSTSKQTCMGTTRLDQCAEVTGIEGTSPLDERDEDRQITINYLPFVESILFLKVRLMCVT